MYLADAHNDYASCILTNDMEVSLESLIAHQVKLQVFAICSSQINNAVELGLTQITEINKHISGINSMCLLSCNQENGIIDTYGIRYVLALEGAEIIGHDIRKLDYLYSLGVRIVGLTWNNNNCYCGNSAHSPEVGLLPKGIELIYELNRRQMPIDLSHASRPSFIQAIELSDVPCMVSHSNSNFIKPHSRNLDDEQIRMLIDTSGYMGICFYPPFLGETGSIEDVYAHIDHIMSLGGERIIGFGSDYNGMNIVHNELSRPNAFYKIIERLANAGYSDDIIKRISHKNLEEYLMKFI